MMDFVLILLQKNFTHGLESYELLVDYCGAFISYVNSHSDGTHSLQGIHFFKSVVKKNTNSSIHSIVHFKQMFMSGWSIHLDTLSRLIRS